MAERQPDFLMVGAPKAGTTAVYAALREHPEVFMPGLKEPHFFCDGMGIETWEEYLALFAPAKDARRLGEASTGYLSDPAAPGRIRAALGRIQIVVFARHPVDQMYSAYHHNRRTHLETLSFEAALAAEPQRRAEGSSAMLAYRHRAELAAPIERYTREFGPENVHVAFFDDLRREPARVLRDVSRFLDIDEGIELTLSRVNRHGVPRSAWLSRFLSRPKRLPGWLKSMDPSRKNRIKRLLREWNTRAEPYGPVPLLLRETLTAEFRPDIEALADSTGALAPQMWMRAADAQPAGASRSEPGS